MDPCELVNDLNVGVSKFWVLHELVSALLLAFIVLVACATDQFLYVARKSTCAKF